YNASTPPKAALLVLRRYRRSFPISLICRARYLFSGPEIQGFQSLNPDPSEPPRAGHRGRPATDRASAADCCRCSNEWQSLQFKVVVRGRQFFEVGASIG